MRTEARVIDLSKTEYGTFAAPDTNRVIRNTYKLLALSTGVAALGAGISILAGFGPLLGVVFTLLALVPLFYLSKHRNSASAVPAMLTFTGLSGLGLGPTLTHYLSLPGGSGTVMTAAVLTTAVTLALTGYVHKTGKDFTRMGGFLFAGLILLVLAQLLPTQHLQHLPPRLRPHITVQPPKPRLRLSRNIIPGKRPSMHGMPQLATRRLPTGIWPPSRRHRRRSTMTASSPIVRADDASLRGYSQVPPLTVR